MKSEPMQLAQTAAFLREHDGFLLLTHRRCDGDTLGSAAALCRGLRLLGKTAFAAANEDVTPRLRFLCDGLTPPADFVPQTVVAVDVADAALLPPSAEQWAERVALAVDHHGSHRDFAARLFVRPEACAAGEIVWQILDALGVEPDVEIWTALYTAVATDTGCFRFSNTTELGHRIAGRAITAGIPFVKINRAFFELKSRARLAMENAVLGTLTFRADGRVCGTVLRRAQIDGAQANNDDLDNLSTLTMALEGVFVGVLLTENRDGSYKVSVRSHAPVDASAICGRFGGGGHPRAAGCTVSAPGEAGLASLLDAAVDELLHTDLTGADV